MQDAVREEDVEFTEVEQALSGLIKVETLVLGIHYNDDVSLRWCNIVVTLTSALVQGM